MSGFPTEWQSTQMLDLDRDSSDAVLVNRAIHDPREFAPLYARYLNPVHRYCYRRLGSREVAEDATSRVFANALSGLHGFRGGSFRAWLFAIAYRVVVDATRSTRPVWPLEAAEQATDPSPTPEEIVLTDDLRRSVTRLLAHLSADQRVVVELRLAGLTGMEIAAVLGRSHAWVRTSQS